VNLETDSLTANVEEGRKQPAMIRKIKGFVHVSSSTSEQEREERMLPGSLSDPTALISVTYSRYLSEDSIQYNHNTCSYSAISSRTSIEGG
jgi:hypothetical protein